jgi:hypothetical protein
MATDQVDVNRDSLLPQAKVWDAQAQTMANIASQANSMGYSGDSGYFVDAVNAYLAAQQDIVIWCQQGAQEMRSIADALVAAKQQYDSTESTNTQNANNILNALG